MERKPLGGRWVHPSGNPLVAALIDLGVKYGAARIVAATNTDLDDRLLEVVRRPLVVTVLIVGIWYALIDVSLPPKTVFLIEGICISVLVVYWATVAFKAAEVFLEFLARRQQRFRFVNRRTLPVFDMASKTIILGGAIYFMFLAWNIELTAWLASAGVLGIAIGFAAKDTLANLFAGVSILADAPYKKGDYLVLDTGERGCVTDIGLRSTRILTPDDVEIILPNSRMSEAKIINESGGPNVRSRLGCHVAVAYGSDIDRVREVLLGVAHEVEDVVKHDGRYIPIVRFRSFGDSGLNFSLLCWIDQPQLRDQVINDINCAVYKRLNEADIEIPYAKHDVYVKSMP